MVDIHQLENKMRSLKLNGMLDTLELRLSQAQKESLGFIQFLELLLEVVPRGCDERRGNDEEKREEDRDGDPFHGFLHSLPGPEGFIITSRANLGTRGGRG